MSLLNLWSQVNNIGSYLLGGAGAKRVYTLTCDGDKVVLPVTPWKYKMTTSQNNKLVDIIEYGEAQLFGNPKLDRLSFSCFFPHPDHDYSFVVGDIKEPTELVEKIKKWKESKEPVRVNISDSPVNQMMAIKEFSYREQEFTRDIYYEIELISWKDLNTPPANNDKKLDEQTGLKERSVEKTPPKVSAVQRCSDIMDASRKAYGQYKYWRGMASSNGMKTLAVKNLRDLVVKKKGTLS
ncbi:MAG: hypothetical protein IJT82_03630 [Schwartzia sp.]|nr:hypothetical protein [Schwartzia sp. (in: firmicutes)]